MKVLMLANRFFPHSGGVERHVMEISTELLRNGHEIKILTEQHDCNLPAQENVFLPEGRISIIRTPFFRNRPHSLLNRAYWKIWRNRCAMILDSDVVHCHDFSVFIYWYLPFRFILFWKSVFITFHGWEGIFPPSKKTITLRKLTSHLTTGNISIGHYISKWYGTKADFVSYGGVRAIGIEKYRDEDQQNYGDVIFVGRLAEDTGILIYLEALRMLHDSEFELKTLICGDGPLRQRCEDFVATHQLPVTFIGWVKEPQRFVAKSKFVLTSGYLSILEALLYGKIVFSVYDNELKHDYLSLIPHSDQLLFIAGTATELTNQLKSIASVSERNQMMSVKGKQWAESQTWQSVATIYQDLWKREH